VGSERVALVDSGEFGKVTVGFADSGEVVGGGVRVDDRVGEIVADTREEFVEGNGSDCWI